MFELQSTHNPHRWHLKLERNLCTGPAHRRFPFGGIGMAASVKAMEQTCRPPVILATAQYLSIAVPGKVVDVEVVMPIEGKQTTQAKVLMHLDDKKIIAVQTALGARDYPARRWAADHLVSLA